MKKKTDIFVSKKTAGGTQMIVTPGEAKPSEKDEYYHIDKIMKEGSQYNVIIGERSNGKTYSTLEYMIKEYCENGNQGAYIRRFDEDLRGKRGLTLFANQVRDGLIAKYSKGEWDNVYYYSGRWYLCRYDENMKRIMDINPFCYGFAISQQEHDKSTSYPGVTTIVFDEFLSRTRYLPDEFVLFMNTISTIIRRRTNVTIFMLGNTVNQYCPYFAEMGIEEVKNMKQGTIRTYQYGESGLQVSVEYCSELKSKKDNNMYFAFNNPKLNMITSGVWEMDLYPHLTEKYLPKDIVFTFFIEFVDDLLQCEIISKDNRLYMYIHKKTTPIKNLDTDIVYTQGYDHRVNIRRNIYVTDDKLGQTIKWCFTHDKVFYQDNLTGEIVRNYLNWCQTEKVKR